MNTENLIIRNETEDDYRTVELLVRESFWNVYRPGCTEHFVLNYLRTSAKFVKPLSFVLIKDNVIIGQNVFMNAELSLDNGNALPVLAMGPICIAPEFKRMGYGKYLLDFCLAEAKKLGYGAVLFEGNYDFYSKCGAIRAKDKNIRYKETGKFEDFLLCVELIDGYLPDCGGEYGAPQEYYIAEEQPEEFITFDSAFPYKEKLILPTQLFS